MTEGDLSQHPADRLIRTLIESRRSVAAGEVAQIVERMATAPFGPGVVAVPRSRRGLIHHGHVLGDHEDSLLIHLVERVVVDRQWASDTTAAQYLDHLRSAIRRHGGRLALYRRRGGSIAAVL